MNLTVELLYDVMFVVMILLALLGNLATMCIIISEFNFLWLCLCFILYRTYNIRPCNNLALRHMSMTFVKQYQTRRILISNLQKFPRFYRKYESFDFEVFQFRILSDTLSRIYSPSLGLFWTIIKLPRPHYLFVEDRRMRNKTNLLVFSLSFADFLNTTFNTTFNFIYMTQRFCC